MPISEKLGQPNTILDFRLSMEMNKSTLKILRFWTATTTFVALAAGFSLSQPPGAIAQLQSQAQSPEVRRLLQTKQCPGCDLSGANLQNADLDEANL